MNCKTLLTLLPLALTLACKDAGDAVTDSGGDSNTGSDADTGEPTQTDGDGDGYFAEVDDCDDANADVNPSAAEVCDSLDNNCDGVADEGVTQTFFADADGDTYGDITTATEACAAEGLVTDNTDCDDTQAAIHPGAQEVCDNLDNDCDSLVDDADDSLFANEGVLSYADADGDGYGDPSSSALTCVLPSGFTEDNTDCDDADIGINPAADEVCDSVDNDCDSLIDLDDDSLTDGLTAYGDGDLDGFGDAGDVRVVCALSAGVVADDQDCDDDDDDVNPDAEELCDSVDNDCDSLIDLDDDSLTDGFTAYGDGDLDGFGDAADVRVVCSLSAGVVADDDDCDDSDDAVNPDAEEVCQDSDDNNCDGAVDEDCPICDGLSVVAYYDSFTAGGSPLDKAQAILGFTLNASSSESTFATAFDSGGWDVLVIDTPGSALPTGVKDRIEDAIAAGSFVIFSYWYLGSEPALATVLGVTVDSSFTSPLPLSAASGSDLWTISETLPSSIKTYSHDAGTNGVVLSPIDASTSETLAIFSGSSTQDAIIATFSGQVIVNGHLPWDYQSTDDDSDGLKDMGELYANELAWVTGCAD